MVSSPRWRSARSGSSSDWRWAGSGVLPTSTSVAISEIDMSTVTPKNGPRQLIAPSSPPSSGPSAMPTPSAVSYRMIAPAKPPLAEATMTASEVAMNSAVPRAYPGRMPGQRAEHDDQHQATDQGALRANPGGHPAGHQHRHGRHHQVAGEQQLDLARRRVQLDAQRGQDRVHEPDAHKRDHAGERDRPDRLGLTERALHALDRVGHTGSTKVAADAVLGCYCAYWLLPAPAPASARSCSAGRALDRKSTRL